VFEQREASQHGRLPLRGDHAHGLKCRRLV
jgi:hypothetical protein